MRVETGFLDDAETVIVAFGSPAKFVKYAIKAAARRRPPHRLRAADHVVAVPLRDRARRPRGVGAPGRLVRAVRRADDRRRAHRRRGPGAGDVHRRRLHRPLRLRHGPAARGRGDLANASSRCTATSRAAVVPGYETYSYALQPHSRSSHDDRATTARHRAPVTSTRARHVAALDARARIEPNKPDAAAHRGAPHVPGLRRAARGAAVPRDDRRPRPGRSTRSRSPASAATRRSRARSTSTSCRRCTAGRRRSRPA